MFLSVTMFSLKCPPTLKNIAKKHGQLRVSSVKQSFAVKKNYFNWSLNHSFEINVWLLKV